MKRAPLLTATLAMVGGILLSEWVSMEVWQLAASLAIAATLACLLRKNRYLFLIAATLCWTIGGIALAEIHRPARSATHYSHQIEEEGTFCGIVTQTPRATERCYKMEVEIEQAGSMAASGKLMLYLYQSGGEPPAYGDKILFRARRQKPFSADSTHTFDYQRYLLHKGITHMGFAERCQIVERHAIGGIKGAAHRLQEQLVGVIRGLDLSAGQQGIAEALLLGYDEDLDNETQSQFRDAGIAHLLCVSGLHVGIIALMLGWMLSFLGRGPIGRKIKGMLMLVGVWAFVLITGMAPSTTRAAILFSFFIIRDCLLLQGNSYNTLAATAMLMLFVDPNLIYDVGFQLSYSAVIGIIAFSQPLYRLIPWPEESELEPRLERLHWRKRLATAVPLRLSQWMMQTLCVTTAATLGTLPFTLLYFHRFPTYFVIANMTIVPLAGVLLATIMLAMLIPQLAPLLGWELSLTESLTKWIAQLPGAVIDIPFTTTQALISGILILALSRTVNRIKE